MKDRIVNYNLKKIKIYYPEYTIEMMEKIKYGIEGLYLFISKLILIILSSILLGQIKEFFIFTIIYSAIRLPAGGMHAKSSMWCLFFSLFIFLLFPYLLNVLNINMILKVIVCIFSFICMLKYSPADTRSKPIVCSKKRKQLKVLSVVIVFIYTNILLFVSNSLIINAIVLSLVLESLIILPISYKLFNLNYNNYKLYN